jgi:hypothetical protein
LARPGEPEIGRSEIDIELLKTAKGKSSRIFENQDEELSTPFLLPGIALFNRQEAEFFDQQFAAFNPGSAFGNAGVTGRSIVQKHGRSWSDVRTPQHKQPP